MFLFLFFDSAYSEEEEEENYVLIHHPQYIIGTGS